MRSLRLLILFLLLSQAGFRSSAQGIAIGEWRDHLPYSNGNSVTEAGDRIYCATPASVFYYDKTDGSVSRLSKVNGLSDIGIASIDYSREYSTLVITYANTNIDLIQHGSIINISDIKRKPILGLKSINRVVVRDRYAYLCCGFGIVVLDLMKNEIKDTYYIGPEGASVNVFDVTFDGTSIWAATDVGIFTAQEDSPNLSNYAAWTRNTLLWNPIRKFNSIEHFNGKIFANHAGLTYGNDTLLVFDGTVWTYYNQLQTPTCRNIVADGNDLMVVFSDYIDVLDTSLAIQNHIWAYFQGDTSLYPQPMDIIRDQQGDYWIADSRHGLLRNWLKFAFYQVLPNGPNGSRVFAMDCRGEKLYAVPGGRNTTFGNEWYTGALYTFSEESWHSLDNRNLAIMDSLRDFITVTADPSDPDHVFAGTWGFGLCEFRGNQLVNIYEGSNSPLQPTPGYPDYQVRIGGVKYDANNNLWVSVSATVDALAVKPAGGGDWLSYNLGNLVTGGSNADLGDFTIDQYGQKWLLMRGNKVLVFRDNGTLTQAGDDQAKILSSGIGYGNIPGSRVRSIATDLDGLVWLGTDEGVVVFYAPENVFSGSGFDAQRIYVTQDGYTQYLLETEVVTTIAVDGSNKKWFGTERAGVFLMSEDGTEQLYHFTEENSPLLSNSVTSIAIDHMTGEVFFGTENGICSFKGMATGGGSANAGVYAYPNPVRPEYNGYIAIKGLVTDADVKITDIAGNLVYSARAEGGQAVWNGRNFSGRKVNTGVYLVFVSNTDGSETVVTKILFKH